MDINIEVRDVDSLSMANRSAYNYMRSVIMGLPQAFREEAADAGMRKAAFEERRHILRAAKSGQTAFKDSPRSRISRLLKDGKSHKHLRKTIRVIKLKRGRGYATVTGARGAKQSWLVNYGHPGRNPGPPHGARPREFATSHIGKIDSQLIKAFTGEVDRGIDRAARKSIRKARANPQRYRTLAAERG